MPHYRREKTALVKASLKRSGLVSESGHLSGAGGQPSASRLRPRRHRGPARLTYQYHSRFGPRPSRRDARLPKARAPIFAASTR